MGVGVGVGAFEALLILVLIDVKKKDFVKFVQVRAPFKKNIVPGAPRKKNILFVNLYLFCKFSSFHSLSMLTLIKYPCKN